MKRFIAASTALLAFAAALPASVANLTLIDGRTFHDATIVSQSPRKVVIKHADGLSGIDKTLLPADLSARYPIDEAAAREADLQAEQARARAAEFHKAEAERAALIRLEREQTALHNAQLAALEAAERRAELAEAELARRATVVAYRDTGYFSPFYRHTSVTPVCNDEPRWNEKSHENCVVRDGRTPRPDKNSPGDRRSPRQSWTHTSATHRTHNPPTFPRTSQPQLAEEDKKPSKVAAAAVRR